MTFPKYSKDVARWSLLKGTTDNRYRRNVKILIARGLRPELARATAGKICRGEIENHGLYVKKLTDNLENLDIDYIIHARAGGYPEISEEDKKQNFEFQLEIGRLADLEEESKHTTPFRERVKMRMRANEKEIYPIPAYARRRGRTRE